MDLIHAYLSSAAQVNPHREALVVGPRRISYERLHRDSSSLAANLQKAGFSSGDRVLFYLENSVETVVGFFGTWMCGGVIVPLNPATPAEKLAYLVQHAEPRVVLTSTARIETVRSALGKIASRPLVVVAGEGGLLSDEVPFCKWSQGTEGQIASSIASEDLAAILYTSGSTGEPKGVMLTHRNLDFVCEVVAEYLEHTGDDRVLCVLQLSFGYGLLQLLVTLRTSGCLVLERGFGLPFDIVRRLQDERITGFAGVPTLWAMLLQLSDLQPGSFPHLRYITNAAAAMPEPFVPRLRKIMPKTRIYLMHGMTECLRTTFLPPDEVLTRTTSVGKGMRGVELFLIDDEGRRLANGETGEMVVRGKNVMSGYWRDPEATSRAFVGVNDGGGPALRSGDLFRTDNDGYFYFVARRDEVIKSRGEKVSPIEIENVIYRLSSVRECRVIGVPDPMLGHVVVAEIVLEEGAVGVDENTIRTHCISGLEPYKVPRVIKFVQGLPKTSGGKIVRRVSP